MSKANMYFKTSEVVQDLHTPFLKSVHKNNSYTNINFFFEELVSSITPVKWALLNG